MTYTYSSFPFAPLRVEAILDLRDDQLYTAQSVWDHHPHVMDDRPYDVRTAERADAIKSCDRCSEKYERATRLRYDATRSLMIRNGEYA